ncbi:MAG: ribosomal-protein-alanine N-acetyltransferase [Anaerolineaceae bacterium]|nr:MAG: ribosomal-protein-alanine N-acetyltransferase [Anaerolineaceae bacterium]
MPLTLRHMRESDIGDVVHIERRVFTNPWPTYSFHHEVSISNCSFMVALVAPPRVVPAIHRPRWRFLWRQRGNGGERVVGYGGLWVVADEGHISSIATHPDQRGNGYGELLLCAMLHQALRQSAGYAVLEVRRTNHIAQALYIKYGFAIVDTKRGYYADGEDGYLMRLDLNDAARHAITTRWGAIRERVHFTDAYTTTPHPRLNR